MFETALLSSQTSIRRRSIVLPASIAAHAAVGLALVGASVWHDDPLSEPPLPVVFMSPGMPAAPPPGSPNGSSANQGAAHAVVRSVPREIPSASPSPATAPDQKALDYEISDIPGSGSVDGAVRGTGTEPGAGIGSEPGDGQGEALTVGGKVTAPVLRHRVEPEYPESARKAGMEGVVILQAIIDTNGQVEQLEVLRSPFALLDQSAVQAVRQWRYQPSTLNGRAVRVSLTVTVTFRIR